MSQTLNPVIRLRAAVVIPYRAMLLTLGGVAFAAGFAVTDAPAAAQATRDAGPELARLLQMMAVLKVTLVAAACWLIDWRLRQPVTGAVAAGYLVAAVAMAAGPGLVWGLAYLVPGAVLLHGGLAAMIVLSCLDGGMRLRIGRRI